MPNKNVCATNAITRLLIGLSTLPLILLIALSTLIQPTRVQAQNPTPDGRLNPDPLIPFAVYCDTNSVRLWGINAQSVGSLTLDVRMSHIVGLLQQATRSGQGIQIAYSGYISLWALPSGKLEAVSVDPSRPRYTFQFGLERCGASAVLPVSGATPIPIYATPISGTVNGFIYVVQRGDTLYRLSLRYNTTVAALVAANGLGWSSLIYVGQRLIIPVGTLPISYPVNPYPTAYPYGYVTPIPVYPAVNPNMYCPNPYTVQTGDTLFKISVRCGTTTTAIAIANGIVNINTIYIGQLLVIPVGP
jgi:LysM repeat protein